MYVRGAKARLKTFSLHETTLTTSSRKAYARLITACTTSQSSSLHRFNVQHVEITRTVICMILMNTFAHMLIRVNITFLAQVLLTQSNHSLQARFQTLSMATFGESLAAPTPENLKRIEDSLRKGEFPGDRSRSPGNRRQSGK